MEEFLKHIRQEKLDTQKNRAEFIKLKFILIAGLFGIGSFKISIIPDNYLLLYLVPFVGLALDLHIYGETFAIRRIGFFVCEMKNFIPIERTWELFVKENRDRFTLVGVNIVSELIFICTAGLLQFKWDNHFRIYHSFLHYSGL
jgi:hypothetical protein